MARKAGLLCERLDQLKNPRILEVGCGSGIFTAAILDRRPDLDLTAMDISPKSVEVAQRRLAHHSHVKVQVGDAFELTESGARYDAVVGNSVLHHLHLSAFLAQAATILAPGGMLWFSEPNMLNPQVALERNVRPIGRLLDNSEDETAFFRWRLRRTLEQAGFVNVEIRPFDFLHPLSPRFAIPLVQRMGWLLEKSPLLCEFAGSLCIVAHKPVDHPLDNTSASVGQG